MKKPQIRLTLVDKKGECPCHRGHRDICPMVMHVAFPYIDILRYGGTLPPCKTGDFRFCCPDADVMNIFRIEKV